MGEVYTSGKRGGKPKQIDGFTGSMQIITETTTWTCPATGEYYISCIGQGGMHQWDYNPQNSSNFGTGGGGGISESKLKLQKDDKIKITIDAGVSSFGSYLSATGGENADIYYGGMKNVSKGGDGSGGNIGNFKGDNGKNKTYDGTALQGGGTNVNAKYGGAAGGIIFMQYFEDSGASYSSCPTSANHGMYPYGSSQGYGSYDSRQDPTYGESGYIKNGAVIIEYMG